MHVTGALSGGHPGRLRAYSGHRGASFVLDRPLTQGERVSVRVRIRGRAPLSFSFAVAHLAPTPPVLNIPIFQPTKLQHFVSRPDLLPPKITVLRRPRGPDGRRLHHPPALARRASGEQQRDHHPPGRTRWADDHRPARPAGLVRPAQAAGLRDQLPPAAIRRAQGPDLVAGLGHLVGLRSRRRGDRRHALRHRTNRQHGQRLPGRPARFRPHPSGDALFTIYSPILVHLAGTAPGALSPLLDALVQEVDIRTGLVVWEWHALGHIPLADSVRHPGAERRLRRLPFQLDPGAPRQPRAGVGPRHVGDLRDRPHSGRILWKLGGKASTFKLGRGARFYFQHDAQLLSGGRVSLFDDEAGPPFEAPQSAA